MQHCKYLYFRDMWEWFCGFIHWLVDNNCCKIGCKILCHCQEHFSFLTHMLLLLQLFGTPFLWPFTVVSLFTVFGVNSKLSSITLLSGLHNAPPHPAPQIRRVPRRHCVHYKFTYLLTYLLKILQICCGGILIWPTVCICVHISVCLCLVVFPGVTISSLKFLSISQKLEICEFLIYCY